MDSTPTFKNPPIVEFVLGAQFSPLVKLSAAHYGRFWDQLGDDWIKPNDKPLIADQFERFDDEAGQRKWRLKLEAAPMVNRLTIINRNDDRLIQMQPTRFHLNWRKTDELKPSYKELIEEFETMFNRFAKFCEREELGSVEVNQWEVTYVDSFPKGEYWETLDDWNVFLPGLFRDKPPTLADSLQLENREVQWTMEIKPKRGRLHLSAGMGRWKAEQPESLMLNLTARGPVDDRTPTLRDGLDLGHRVAVDQFLVLVAPETKERWGVMQ